MVRVLVRIVHVLAEVVAHSLVVSLQLDEALVSTEEFQIDAQDPRGRIVEAGKVVDEENLEGLDLV